MSSRCERQVPVVPRLGLHVILSRERSETAKDLKVQQGNLRSFVVCATQDDVECGRRPRNLRGVLRLLAILCATLVLFSCEREKRHLRDQPAAATRRTTERLVNLVPGPYTADVYVRNPYEGNAYGISEGKRLYTWFNCVGCHSHGGGGMGPPLMDDKWIYGSDPEQIFATILEGRPNGMPSFRGKIPDYQVWQIAAYVQSLSGMVPKDAAPGRPDNMYVKKPESMTPDLVPRREPARRP